MELWKAIKGYEGIYEISSEGRVKSLARTTRGRSDSIIHRAEKILKLNPGSRGYLQIFLSKNCKDTSYRVSRLVALAFVPKVKGKNYVDHINGDKLDNRAVNLRWCTLKENNQFAAGEQNLSRRGSAHGMSVLTEELIPKIRARHREGANPCQIAREFGVSRKAIRDVLAGNTWRHVKD